MILDCENNVLPSSDQLGSLTSHLAGRAVERSIAGRRDEYEREMARIVDATFELIRRTGTIDPSMREILAETGLSTQAFYRYFNSKDELMLGLLDEGRRRLLGTLERRMQRADSPSAEIRAWIEGVLAQASTATAAARTRPWIANEPKLTELFPAEQRASVDLLVDLLITPATSLGKVSGEEDVRRNATSVYRLVFATLQAHLADGTRPAPKEVDELIAFCLRGLGG